ncbi:MAG TPA: PAS domain-containing sensor histidine kinase [Rhizomicrobium sp.]|jgi:sigma-B regulation protein RsbU (phosphoserine phosphatase)
MVLTVDDLEDLYDNAPFAYVLMQPAGSIVAANATLSDWLGYARDALVGKRIHDLLTPSTRIFYETNVAPILHLQGAFENASLNLKTANGETVAVTAAASTRRDKADQTGLVRVALFKATERRRYEKGLIEAHKASQEAERATQRLLDAERETSVLREQFIAVLGHDLRNPLASINGGLRLLQKEPPEERRKLLLELLQASVVRMSVLIDNVLDFARGRLGAGIPLELKTGIWLAPILEQVTAELRIGSPDRTIETDFDLPRPIRCDPPRIGQLLSNLLGNAITHGSPERPVRVHADNDNARLTIWVANAGDPISPVAMEHLFQPFFRGQVRKSQQGLGLGLHIASEIAKAHGGTLDVTSTPEETRFTFIMPTGDG